MIRPRELETGAGRNLWDMITAAASGDTAALERLLDRDPGLSRAQYFYTQPIHFAVRAGHLDAVQLLAKRAQIPRACPFCWRRRAGGGGELRQAWIIRFTRRQKDDAGVSVSFWTPSQLW